MQSHHHFIIFKQKNANANQNKSHHCNPAPTKTTNHQPKLENHRQSPPTPHSLSLLDTHKQTNPHLLPNRPKDLPPPQTLQILRVIIHQTPPTPSLPPTNTSPLTQPGPRPWRQRRTPLLVKIKEIRRRRRHSAASSRRSCRCICVHLLGGLLTGMRRSGHAAAGWRGELLLRL
jgi:hypothetical protein